VKRIGLALLVGLTAIATVIAGMPHFVCRCPDGRVKPICFSLSSGAAGCCCGGACCHSAEAGQAIAERGSAPEQVSEGCASCCFAEGGCCSHHCGNCKGLRNGNGVSGSDVLSHDVSAKSPGCIRTLVSPEFQVVPEAAQCLPIDSLACTAADTGALYVSPALQGGGKTWEHDRGPPPADLVTLLRRLLI
jgi:hypothetical protein